MEHTVPFARAAIVESITLLEMLRSLLAVMSRERAKLSYRWQAAVIQRWATSKGRLVREKETGEPFQVRCCPDCTAPDHRQGRSSPDRRRSDGQAVRLLLLRLPLWQADKFGPKRYPLADYVKRHMRGFFDLLITDEVH